jgi:hypothetical protein
MFEEPDSGAFDKPIDSKLVRRFTVEKVAHREDSCKTGHRITGS